MLKLDKRKLQLAMAEAEKGAYDLKSISPRTYYRAIAGDALNTRTIGRLAKELNVKVSDIVEKREEVV